MMNCNFDRIFFAIGIYFCVFDFYRVKGTALNLNGFLVDLIAGGLAGCTSWVRFLIILKEIFSFSV